MTGKVLRRCAICKNYQAIYLVEHPVFGTCRICQACWQRLQRETAAKQNGQTAAGGEEDKAGTK